jgi:hypothetical protein
MTRPSATLGSLRPRPVGARGLGEFYEPEDAVDITQARLAHIAARTPPAPSPAPAPALPPHADPSAVAPAATDQEPPAPPSTVAGQNDHWRVAYERGQERYESDDSFLDWQGSFQPPAADASLRSDLLVINPAAPPALHDPGMVWFDLRLGFVTSSFNQIVPKDTLGDVFVIVCIGFMNWGTCGALGVAGGAGMGAATTTGGAMAAGAAYGGLVNNGRLDLRDNFKGAAWRRNRCESQNRFANVGGRVHQRRSAWHGPASGQARGGLCADCGWRGSHRALGYGRDIWRWALGKERDGQAG